MEKKKIATVWLAGCSGCHMSLLDLDERLLEIAKLADIVKSPVVDAKAFPECDIALVEGAVSTNEHLEEIHNIRRKSKLLVSFGDCAVTGNVSALRNAFSTETVLSNSYVSEVTNDNPEHTIPGQDLGKLLDRVCPIHEVVNVDFVMPGCPPSADLIYYVLSEFLNGRTPTLEKGRLRYG